jgi:hypothetical protein
MATKKQETSWLRKGVIHMAHWHFVLVAFLMGQIVLYDASKLITPDVVMKRWFFTSGLLVVSAVVWYLARSKVSSSNGFYRILTLGLILADIVVASFSVYTQRGMASRAVMLYAIPIIVSAILISRVALFATAILCIAAYTATAQAYFVLNFNEGYKVELYGEVGFYSLAFLLIAGLVWTVIRTKHKR